MPHNVWDDVPDWGGVGALRLDRAETGLDVVSFPRGAAGGHQIRNDGAETARVLIVSSNASPDVAEYPETGKVASVVGGEHHFHRTSDAVEHAGPE